MLGEVTAESAPRKPPDRAWAIRRGLLLTVALVGSLTITGCALLHRPDGDSAAQSASKSFDEAALGKTVE